MRALQIIIASICWVLAMCGEFASKCLTTGSLRKKKKPSYTVFADFHNVLFPPWLISSYQRNVTELRFGKKSTKGSC